MTAERDCEQNRKERSEPLASLHDRFPPEEMPAHFLAVLMRNRNMDTAPTATTNCPASQRNSLPLPATTRLR